MLAWFELFGGLDDVPIFRASLDVSAPGAVWEGAGTSGYPGDLGGVVEAFAVFSTKKQLDQFARKTRRAKKWHLVGFTL